MFRVKLYNRGSVVSSVEFDYAGFSPTKQFVKGGDEDMVFDMSDLMELDREGAKVQLKKVKKQESKKIRAKIALYPEDTVEDLKNKIFLVTGYYPFQQHIWADFKGAVVPLSYKIRLDDKPAPLNILAVEDHKTLEGLPIDEDLYAKSPSITIDAMDKFVSLSDIVGRYGNSVNMAILDDYLTGPNIKEIVKDRQQVSIAFRTFVILYFPMLNYEAFSEYVQTRHIRSSYPLLQPTKSHIEAIYDGRARVRDFGGHKRLDMAVSSSVIGVYSQADVNIRNLFDELVLGPKIPYCQAVIWKDRRRILLEKNWNNTYIKSSIKNQNRDANTITIVVRSRDFSRTSSQEKSEAGMAFMQFIIKIREDGRYTIKTLWSGNMEMSIDQTYQTVQKLVNPTIERINSFGGRVFGSDRRVLEPMTRGNTYFLSLNLSFYWVNRISTTAFDVFMEKLKTENGILAQKKASSYDFVFDIGALRVTEHIKENLFEYGNGYAYLFDMNYRERLSVLDKYGQISLVHRATDVKFEVSDLQEHLIPAVSMYLSKLCGIYSKALSNIRMSKESAKLLRTLKEKDPNLYDYGRVFNKRKLQVYSIKCQKKHQPLYVDSPSASDIKQAREDKRKGIERKSGIVEYYNFTTDEAAYYKCPNPKFPYLRFVTGVHPKKFCLPCCQKSSAPVPYRKDEKTLKAKIQRDCMDTHIYTSDRTEPKSRYIMVYGKNIEPDRLVNLPDGSLATLFRNDGKEEEYYIYGVPQSFSNIHAVGILHSYAVVLNRPVKKVIEDMIIAVQKNTSRFEYLLEGKISQYFENALNLVSEIRRVFILNQPTEREIATKVWNNLFASISTLFLGLNTIKFVDSDSSSKDKDSTYLYIPRKVMYYDEFFLPGANCIVVEKHISASVSYYYPILLVNSKKFFKDQIIHQRTFDEDDLPFIKRMLRVMLKPRRSLQIDMYFISSFVEAYRDYELVAQHLGYQNYCYAVTLSIKGREIYVPIAHSQGRRDVKIKPFPSKYNTKIKDIQSYFKLANSFIKRLSKDMSGEMLYPLYNIEQWLEYRNSVVGLVSSGLNFYISPISSAVAMNIAKVDTAIQLYHPSTTNSDIDGNKILTRINKTAPRAFYSVYSHQLVVLQFAMYFRQQKNKRIREKIGKMMKKLNLDSYSTKIMFISKLSELEITVSDRQKLSKQLQIITKIDALLRAFESDSYDFDMEEFENLRKSGDKKKVEKELKNISKKIFKSGKINLREFPNIITSCSVDQDYCDRGKLVIDDKRLTEAIGILSTDIINPLKEHSVFYMPNIILNYYSFQIRPREEITIEAI